MTKKQQCTNLLFWLWSIYEADWCFRQLHRDISLGRRQITWCQWKAQTGGAKKKYCVYQVITSKFKSKEGKELHSQLFLLCLQNPKGISKNKFLVLSIHRVRAFRFSVVVDFEIWVPQFGHLTNRRHPHLLLALKNTLPRLFQRCNKWGC